MGLLGLGLDLGVRCWVLGLAAIGGGGAHALSSGLGLG